MSNTAEKLIHTSFLFYQTSNSPSDKSPLSWSSEYADIGGQLLKQHEPQTRARAPKETPQA